MGLKVILSVNVSANEMFSLYQPLKKTLYERKERPLNVE